ncbi:hypothetical protein [Riemerella anatipestifer]|uniref:hypothetical protein n=1 Tax=Riemerella anatipestifer TaxID=34085 RepID=UPI001AD6A14C|nr:hypothetical protein [Riemerella anatipestifer]MBO4232717.1 hypothetical protein [Riemerella anatipestifer]MCO4303625.1 hypothetical protein [Riemerella anatipestifer]MCO7352192.1 hypothetical protein [Riemerella anatipestifer]MCQ4040056.1 hypothetical protein [Riemerella anatipestifer]MCT6760705.1 hypothetical protein [Riemerella anatipestifer]
MKSRVLYLVLLLICTGCISQEQKDEEQIKKTVLKYWKAVRENNLPMYNSLIYDADKYPGGTSSELFFLNKHYNEINAKKDLLNDVKIKDTVDVFLPSVSMKYVQYTYKKENDSNNLKKPLIITLMFYKPVGLDKIHNPGILQNHIGWDRDR